MKKIVSTLLGAVSLLLAAGCASSVKQIGQVGNVQFYRVRANSFSGPNIASLVTKDANTGEVSIQQTYAGPGLGAATISAVGHVGSAAVLGLSFPKNVGDNINASGGVVTANGGSASSHATTSSTSTSTSSSNATGNGGAGGAGGTGGAGGAGHSHPDSPGNGGTPGNGGQNPNKP